MRSLVAQIRFDVCSQLRRPFVWFCLVAYLVLAIGDTAQAGWSASGGQWINGADAIATRSIIYSLLGVLVAAGIVAEPMARDRVRGTEPLVLVTGSSRRSLALGRFFVATAITLVAAMMFAPGIMLGTLVPGVDPAFVGPFRPGHYASAVFAFIIPNFVLWCSVAFAVASLTRSVAAAYAVSVVFVASWVLVRMVLGQDVLRHDIFQTASLLDPFGTIASTEFVMGRTVLENNERFPPLAGLLLVNRVVWLCVSVGLIVIGVAGFPMRESSGRARRVSFAWVSRLHFAAAGIVPRPLGWLGRPGRIAAWELRSQLRSTGVLLALAFAALSVWFSASTAVTHQFSLPTTDLLVHTTGFYFDKVLVLVIAFAAGDLVWRERAARVDEMTEALPVSDAHRYLGRLIALLSLIGALWAISIVVNVLYQAANGYTRFELDLYLVDTFVFKAPYYVFFAVLALTLQSLVRHRYIAMGLALAVYLSGFVLDALGVYHPVLRFGESSFFWYSLMDGYGHFWPGHLWMLAYWTVGSVVLAMLGWASTTRGPEPPPLSRRLLKPGRTRGSVAAFFTAAAAFVALGITIWVQSVVVGPWPHINPDAQKAAVERALGEDWRGRRQPRVVEIEAAVDLDPESRSLRVSGMFVLHNPHDSEIDEVLVLAEPWLRVERLELADATEVDRHERLNAVVLQLTRPMTPGEERVLEFETAWSPPPGLALHAHHDGIPQVVPVEVIGNGTSLLNLQIMPAVGYTDRVEHKPEWKRRRYGLDGPWVMPDGPDAERQAHATLHLDWVRRVEMTIRTAADQTAYHPGRLEAQWTEPDGRRGFRYVIDRPSRGWATIVSGRLVETRFSRPGVPDVVLAHDPEHDHVLSEFGTALLDAAEHFQRAYGPAPFDEFRMVEQSLHFDGMGARSGMGFASEILGWKTDLRATGGEDLQTMAAHLMGMSWWGDQVIPANTPGAKVIHAGLPYWTAQLYLHQARDATTDRRLRRQSIGEMFRSRSAFVDEESPFDTEMKDSTILRTKGAGLMLHLAELVGGPECLERHLAGFLEQWRHRGPSYPTAGDFLTHLRALDLPDDANQFLDSAFSHVSTWDIAVRQATAARTADGRWRVTADIDVREQRSTGWGQLSDVPISTPVRVVVYAGTGFDQETELVSEWVSFGGGEGSATRRLEWVVDREPGMVGADPLLFLADPSTHDNVARVERLEAVP